VFLSTRGPLRSTWDAGSKRSPSLIAEKLELVYL
jgi:hypothetical protein